ncbi:MAG: cytochrome c family protein [Asticcacaulis sp.]
MIRFLPSAFVLALALAAPVLADPVSDGQQVFVQCKACHAVDPAKKSFGPNLFGVAGRKAGTQAGYTYSTAMAGAGFKWTDDNLDAFLTDPKTRVPGNNMPFAGVKDPVKRAALIAYLKSLH